MEPQRVDSRAARKADEKVCRWADEKVDLKAEWKDAKKGDLMVDWRVEMMDYK